MYRTGSPADLLQVLEAENSYWFHAHPRTKGSTGYPDAEMDTPWIRQRPLPGRRLQSRGWFPLEYLEVVWGDGELIDRQIIRATDSTSFGTRRFEIPFDAAGKSWVRLAAWDSAGNGAFVQPVWLAVR